MSDKSSQQPPFDENTYARPNQRWICGRDSDGCACPRGPSQQGVCRVDYECAPYQKGETWVCSRTRTQGGVCDDGPLPDGTCCRKTASCQPVRSVMAKRGLVSFLVFALAVGVVLIMFSVPARNNVVSPGPVVFQHSSAVQSCADCHEMGENNLDDWFHAALDSDRVASQSSLCLRCHEKDLGNHALMPHGQSPGSLAMLAQRLKDDGREDNSSLLLMVAKAGFGSPRGGVNQTLACATCHHEHRGVEFDLTKMANSQCQSCHQVSFHSFSQGHPEFSQFPYQRRTRLYFDHDTHFNKHFQQKGRSNQDSALRKSCVDCHQADETGKYMRVRSFEQSCASCHTEQITDDFSEGILLISIPRLDVAALRQSAMNPGAWPDDIYPLHVEADGEIGPLMKVLLRSRADYAALAPQLEGLDLTDLSSASDEQLQVVNEFVWLFKETLFDVVTKNQAEFQKQLVTALRPQASEIEVAAFVEQVPHHMLIEMQQRWLPNLLEEVKAHHQGDELPPPNESPEQALVKNQADAKRELEEAKKQLVDAQDSQAAKERVISAQSQATAAQQRLKEAQTLLRAKADLEKQTRLRESSNLDQAAVNGWYLRAYDLSLRYRPTGHADKLLQSLLDISVHFVPSRSSSDRREPAANSAAAKPMQELFAVLSSPFDSGRCMKCHAADVESSQIASINWTAYRPSMSDHRFTKFKHAPHVTLLTNDACKLCHRPNSETSSSESIFRTEFINSDWSLATDSRRYECDFAPMAKADCATCHVRQAAGDSCLTCHNYHVH